MPRRRLQRGNLYQDGQWWRVRWYEDVRDGVGLRKVRRSEIVGAATLKKKEARKLADELLAPINAKAYVPASIMSVAQFIEQHFEPERLWTMKQAGKLHYTYCINTWINPNLGTVPLRELTTLQIQRVCKGIIDSGRSITTANHVKVALGAIIQYAKELRIFHGDNPAYLVRLPDSNKKKKPALSFEQAQQVLLALKQPYRTMALLSMTTSLRIGEICALRWGRVNLSGEPMILPEGIMLPPMSFAVIEGWYRGEFGPVKTKASERVQPIPLIVLDALRELKRISTNPTSDSLVFQSSNGTVIDSHNAAKRHIKPAGKAAGVPGLSWHSFRRTTSTLTSMLNMPKADRVALMGHAGGAMTDYYTDSDLQRRRGFLDEMATRIMDSERTGTY